MATEILNVSAAGDLANWTPSTGSNYQCVTSDDSDYVETLGSSYVEDAHNLTNPASVSGTINSVTVHVICRKTGTSTNNQVAPLIRLAGTNTTGSNFAITTSDAEYSAVLARPGGGSWSVDDLNSLQVGYRGRARGTGTEGPRVDKAWVVVDYTPTSNHPAPTSLECDRQSQPESASDDPVFSAIWQATGDSGTATHAYVQVSEVNTFASFKWDSGWIDIADISDNTRCQLIDYAGTELSSDPPNGWYYWRIKFKDGSSVESDWSGTAQFKGVVRPWGDRSYALRRKLLLNTDHADVPGDFTYRFKIKTGNRSRVTGSGMNNDAIQEAGYMVADYGNKTHVVFLGELGSDGLLGIYINTLDRSTGIWGTPYRIDDAKTAIDTHNYPTMCIDNNGIIHVFYGCHNAPCYYTRSRVSNESGAFPGDGDENGVWHTPITLGSDLTYPVAFVVPSTNRVVMIARGGNQLKTLMAWSTDGGANWFVNSVIVNNNDSDGFRTYCYGVRFDRTRERLHIGYSFIKDGNITQGVYYAYSDFTPGIAEGFFYWKGANGFQIGITTAVPITRSSADPVIVNEAGDRVIFFCRHIALTTDGQPLIFWAYASDLELWGQEASFGMSRWDSGSSQWVHKWITEEYDIKARTDRSGVPSIVDADGVIHTFTSTDSVVERHHIPTGNGFHTNYSTTGAASGYLAVDDGVERYDAADTYVGGTTSGEASFTSNKTLPDGVVVVKVGVEAVIEDQSTGCNFRPFLRIGGVDYEGDDFSSIGSGWQTIRFWWDLNPNTGQAWTKAGAEGAEFGVKQTVASKTWRITRLNRLPLVQYSTSNENFASEIAELTSSDLGANWSIRRVTENSFVGVPMLNIKHYYTNRRIELVWCAGRDVFYLDQRPYGLVRNDARDLRIYWKGAASSAEQHRIIDYADHQETTVSFRAPEAISAGKKAGTKDLYVSYGNPNQLGNPLSDPNQVFPLLFENFETLDNGDNLHGQRGWTVLEGDATIYASPPEHNNSVYAGSKSLKMAAVGTQSEVEKSLQAATSDIVVDGAVMLWGSAARLWIKAVDGSNNVFAAGINGATGYACYLDGNGWHDHATIRAWPGFMSRIKLQITASGCSAWINDQKICDEISAITSVSKVRLGATSLAHFDLVHCYRSLHRRVYQSITSSFTDNAITHNSDHTSTYQSTNDGKHDMSATDTVRIEVKVRARLTSEEIGTHYADVHVWLSSGIVYNSNTIIDDETLRITPLVINTWVSGTVVFYTLAEGSYSVKVDYYASDITPSGVTIEIEEIKRYYFQHDPIIELQAEEVSGFLIDMALLGRGTEQFTTDMKLQDYYLQTRSVLPVEIKRGLQTRSVLPVEIKRGLQTRSVLPVEIKRGLQTRSVLPVEFAVPFLATVRTAVELLRRVTQSGRMNTEYQGAIAVRPQLAVEQQVTLTTQTQIFGEWLAKVTATEPLPADSLAAIEMRLLIPTEYRGSTAVAMTVPVEYLRSLLVMTRTPAEFLYATIATAPLSVDAGASAAVALQLPIEVRGGVTIVLIMPVEQRQTLLAQLTSPVEFNRLVLTGAIMPAESLRRIQISSAAPVEWAGSMQVDALVTLPVEYLGTVQVTPPLQVEANRKTTESAKILIDFAGTLSVSSAAAVEWLETIQFFHRLEVESLRILTEGSRSFVEYLERRYASAAVAVDFVAAVVAAQRLAVEWLGEEAFSVGIALPIEWRASLDAANRLHVEALTTRTVANLLPLEALQRTSAAVALPVDFKNTISSAIARIGIDWVQQLAAALNLKVETGRVLESPIRASIEHGLQTLMTWQLPVEFAGAIAFSATMPIPIEWRRTIIANQQTPIESRAHLSILGGRLLIESGRAFAASNRFAVEYGEALRVAQQILAEWVGTLNATATMHVDYVSPVAGTITTNIEFNKRVTVQSRLEVEQLLQVLEGVQLPVEYIGVFLATLAIARAQLFVPELAGAMVRTPAIADALLRCCQLSGVTLTTAQLHAAAARIAELLKAELRKGTI